MSHITRHLYVTVRGHPNQPISCQIQVINNTISATVTYWARMDTDCTCWQSQAQHLGSRHSHSAANCCIATKHKTYLRASSSSFCRCSSSSCNLRASAFSAFLRSLQIEPMVQAADVVRHATKTGTRITSRRLLADVDRKPAKIHTLLPAAAPASLEGSTAS